MVGLLYKIEIEQASIHLSSADSACKTYCFQRGVFIFCLIRVQNESN